MRCPAAPFHEAGVIHEVESICREQGLEFQKDAFGNVLVCHNSHPSQRPLVLAAHLDHPGFTLVRSLGAGRWRARFLGGVGDAYFRPGSKLRLMPGTVPAVLGKRMGKAKDFELCVKGSPTRGALEAKPAYAVWELPDLAQRNGRIYGRACDDLIGATVVLATLIELKRSRARVNALGMLSRAEEVGFMGAVAAASHNVLPPGALVISLETSREMPPVTMGQGVILRVGDRASIFDSAAMRFLAEVAGELAKRDKGVVWHLK